MPSRPWTISRGILAAVVISAACLAAPVGGASAQLMQITSGPAGPTNDSTPEFSFFPDAGECRLLPVMPGFSACTSPFPQAGGEYAIPFPDGDYRFEVRAAPADSPDWREFTIDTDPPDTQITGGPGDTTDTTAVFRFSAPGAASTSCRLDGGPWSACGSPQTYSGLSLGRHRFEVTAVDAAGNQDPTPAEHVWQVLRPGLVIPGTAKLAVALARELVQIRRALSKVRLRTLARRKTILFKTFDALTAGRVEIRARARVRQGAKRRWIATLRGKREVPDAGRHPVRTKITKKGRRLARRRQKLPLELRLSFTDLAGRSLWATSKLTLKR
ncbi:MAG TPA: hypothetical protein VGW14_06850 [Thermoleophilaceae bacterium]|nr:hypothetical protein [Thermoleophilaceae bacterium]